MDLCWGCVRVWGVERVLGVVVIGDVRESVSDREVREDGVWSVGWRVEVVDGRRRDMWCKELVWWRWRDEGGDVVEDVVVGGNVCVVR